MMRVFRLNIVVWTPLRNTNLSIVGYILLISWWTHVDDDIKIVVDVHLPRTV